LEVAAICINSRTGGIRGIVGGRSLDSGPFNRALDARRGLGEIFTPFIYAASAERGKQPLFEQPLRTGREIGHGELVRLAERFGFAGPFAEGDDLYRGGVSATPLEVVTAAATLAAAGKRPRTYLLHDLRDADLNQIFEITHTATPVFQARSTAAALAMQFPDGEPRLLTAASPASSDVWAVSFGSRHAICLWIGHDKPRRLDDSAAIRMEAERTIERMARSLTTP
jgi:penicillin-binding protein 1A